MRFNEFFLDEHLALNPYERAARNSFSALANFAAETIFMDLVIF